MDSSIVTVKRYRGTHENKLHDTLRQFINNIAVASTEYCKGYLAHLDYMDYNLLSTERGVYSLISVAIHGITPIHQSEMGVIRRVDRRRRGNYDRNRTASGRVDLWCYSKGIEYFFEFKRTFISPKRISGCTVPNKVVKSWRKVTNQIEEVKRGVALDSSYEGYEDHTYFIGMHLITLRQRSKKSNMLDTNFGDILSENKIRQWTGQMSPNVDSVIVWNIAQEEMKSRPIDWDRSDHEIQWEAIPCHLFCFKVERISQSRPIS